MRVRELTRTGFVALFGLLLWCATARAETLSVGAVGSANAVNWPHYIAEAKGFYAAEGLTIDLAYSQSSAAALQALTGGSTSLALTVGLAHPVNAIAHDAALAIVSIDGDVGPYALMGKKGLTSIKELRGKTVSVDEAKGTTMIYVNRMLVANGLKRADMDFVYAGATAARFAALQSGVADAAIITAPQLFRAESDGFPNLGYVVDYAKDVPFTGHVASRAWAAQNKATLAKFLGAYTKAILWFYDDKNRGEAIDILQKVVKMDRDDVAKSYDFFRKIGFFSKAEDVSRIKLDTFLKAFREIDPSVTVAVDKLVMPEATRVVN